MNAAPTPGAQRHVVGLDGLRAVAVLAVLGYHAELPWLAGGFLGVDVFFVLSGFLITTLLVAEQGRRGTIALLPFYVRRTLRLLPALLLLCTAIQVQLWRMPHPQLAGPVHREMAATLLYVANWAEIGGWIRPLGFFGHAWSLAIEEQFYIAWPLLLRAMLGRWSRTTTTVVVAAMAAASGLLRALLWTGPEASMRVFHGSDTRAEALLIGCTLALLLGGDPGGCAAAKATLRGGRPVTTTAAAVAAAVLALAMATADPDAAWMFRGGFTVVALASAALIADLVTNPAGLPARALSWKPLVVTGRLSYGLYLWHWPVFLMTAPMFTGLAPLPTLALRFALSFAAATVSWWAVERWFLRWKNRWRSDVAA